MAPVPVYNEVRLERVTESRISTVMALLPSSIQSRMNPLRSIRRSISLSNLRTQPVQDLAQRPVSEPTAATSADQQSLLRKGTSLSLLEATPVSGRGAVLETQYRSAQGQASGIDRRFARQGAMLVSSSLTDPQFGFDEGHDAFERKVYIDGLAYLLRGLPQNLDAGEIDQLRAALPSGTLHPILPPAYRGTQGDFDNAGKRSILHRAVQCFVVNLIIVLNLLLPYVLLIFKFAAQVERKHKVSERVVGSGIDMANLLGRQSATMTEKVYKMNDGKVGNALSGAIVWAVDGITRGISDGIGEGMMVARVRTG